MGTHRVCIPLLIPHPCLHQTSNKYVISVCPISMPAIGHTEINQIHILGSCMYSNMQSISGSLQSAFSQKRQVQSLQQSPEVVCIIVPIWQIRKLRPRAVNTWPVIVLLRSSRAGTRTQFSCVFFFFLLSWNLKAP